MNDPMQDRKGGVNKWKNEKGVRRQKLTALRPVLISMYAKRL